MVKETTEYETTGGPAYGVVIFVVLLGGAICKTFEPMVLIYGVGVDVKAMLAIAKPRFV